MDSDEPSTSALAKTPGKTFAAMPASWMNSAKTPSAKTPGGAKTPARLSLAKTPAGKPKTPGVSSMFSRAPERVVVDAKPKPKTPGGTYHRQLMLPARKTPGKKGAPMANPAPSMLSSLPNATRAEFWLNKAIREEERSGDLAQALYHIDTGIKREAEPVQSLRDAKTALQARMRTEHAPAPAEAAPAPPAGDDDDGNDVRGSVVVMEAVRTPTRLLTSVRGRETAVTTVRRSARMTPDSSGVRRHSPSVRAAMDPNSIQRTLSANDYAYVPNGALEGAEGGADDVDDAVASLEAFRGDVRNAPPLTVTNDDDDERGNVENRPRDDGVAGVDEPSRRLMGVTPGVTTRTTPRSFTVNSSGKKSRGVVYQDSRGSSGGGRNGRNGSLSKARSLDAPAPRRSPAVDATARKMSFSSHSGNAAGDDGRVVVDSDSPAGGGARSLPSISPRTASSPPSRLPRRRKLPRRLPRRGRERPERSSRELPRSRRITRR